MDTRQKRYIIDIDGTICTKVTDFPSNYNKTKPLYDRIEKINKLREEGIYIIYWTARGQTTGTDWRELTMKQLNEWGCKYDELWMNKPMYDRWIDDKAENADDLDNW
jgi:histidinol phosphatase-like enzyme